MDSVEPLKFPKKLAFSVRTFLVHFCTVHPIKTFKMMIDKFFFQKNFFWSAIVQKKMISKFLKKEFFFLFSLNWLKKKFFENYEMIFLRRFLGKKLFKQYKNKVILKIWNKCCLQAYQKASPKLHWPFYYFEDSLNSWIFLYFFFILLLSIGLISLIFDEFSWSSIWFSFVE